MVNNQVQMSLNSSNLENISLPLVSLLIPGWNEGENIVKCIDSLKKQTYQKYNLFLILGGNDPYIQKAKDLQSEKIIILDQIEPNKNKALNLALKHPRIGEILIFTDIDCQFQNDYIERYVNDFKDLTKNVVASGIEPYPLSGNFLERYVRKSEHRRIENLPEKGESLVGANFAVRKDFLIQKFNGFDESIISSTDAAFICQLKTINEPIFLDKHNFVSTDLNTESIYGFVKQQSRWFKNVLLYSKDFHTKRNLTAYLIRTMIAWGFFVFIPALLILNSIFLNWSYLSYLLELGWFGYIFLFGYRKFKDLNRGEVFSFKLFSKNIFASVLLVFILTFIALIGSIRAIFSSSKQKNWKM